MPVFKTGAFNRSAIPPNFFTSKPDFETRRRLYRANFQRQVRITLRRVFLRFFLLRAFAEDHLMRVLLALILL